MPEAALQRNGSAGAVGDEPPRLGEIDVSVDQERREPRPEQLLARVPDEALDRRADVGDRAVGVENREQVGGVLHERAEPRLTPRTPVLAALQRVLDLTQRRDVAPEERVVVGRDAVAPAADDRAVDVELTPVERPHHELPRPPARALQVAADRVRGWRAVALHDQPVDAHVAQVVAVAERDERARRRVEVDQSPRRVADADQVRRGIGELRELLADELRLAAFGDVLDRAEAAGDAPVVAAHRHGAHARPPFLAGEPDDPAVDLERVLARHRLDERARHRVPVVGVHGFEPAATQRLLVGETE
ncbi:MAG: hypothetical protein KatS3mg010_2131 [Acidimicrobiia bacterium]|nr:MAG: hypothetical protein KatS3mg010_2131 [Acidimicrobiia bacterium]